MCFDPLYKYPAVYDTLLSVSQGGGTIQMTDVLAIINFPADVQQRIKDARGPVTVNECSATSDGHKCKATNSGIEVSEDIPGSSCVVGITGKAEFSCTYHVGTAARVITFRTFYVYRLICLDRSIH
jgi:hypothetical protein